MNWLRAGAIFELVPPLNALHEMAGLTAEIISRSVFGNELGEENASAVTAGFTSYQSLIDSINLGYFIGFDDGLPIFRTPSLRRSIRRIHTIIDKIVEDHLAGHGEHNSMVDLLIRRQQRNPELKLDVVALRNEAATIFMAGHETTAATLTWAWYLLARAPWIEKLVHDEIKHVCGNRVPTMADVDKLEWCKAVIEETLRLYPPVPILARQNREKDNLNGMEIASNSLILIVPWLLPSNGKLVSSGKQISPGTIHERITPCPPTAISPLQVVPEFVRACISD